MYRVRRWNNDRDDDPALHLLIPSSISGIGAICAHPSRFAGPFLLQRERARASLDFSLTTRTPLVLTY